MSTEAMPAYVARFLRTVVVAWGAFVVLVATLGVVGPLGGLSEADPIRRSTLATAALFAYAVAVLAPLRVNGVPGVALTRRVILWVGALWFAVILVEGTLGWLSGRKHWLIVPVVLCFLLMGIVAAWTAGREITRLET